MTKYLGLFAVCFISSLFGGVVSTLMSVYLPVAVKDLLGEVSTERFNDVSAAINSVFIFGWMFGGITWGFLCDRIGRSRTVVLSTICFGLFTLLTGMVSSWFGVMVCRFMSGFGVGGVLVTTTILVSETWSGKKRAVALGILSISIPVCRVRSRRVRSSSSRYATRAARPCLSLRSVFRHPVSRSSSASRRQMQ